MKRELLAVILMILLALAMTACGGVSDAEAVNAGGNGQPTGDTEIGDDGAAHRSPEEPAPAPEAEIAVVPQPKPPDSPRDTPPPAPPADPPKDAQAPPPDSPEDPPPQPPDAPMPAPDPMPELETLP